MNDKGFDTKGCSRCKQVLPVYEFSLRSSITGKRASMCRVCHRAYVKEHYKKNTHVYKEKAKKWVKKNPDKRKISANRHAKQKAYEQKRLAVAYKGGKCTDCAGVFPQAAFDFHHLDPRTKDYHLAQLLNSRGFEFAKEELDKCVLLCANCHRIRHANE